MFCRSEEDKYFQSSKICYVHLSMKLISVVVFVTKSWKRRLR